MLMGCRPPVGERISSWAYAPPPPPPLQPEVRAELLNLTSIALKSQRKLLQGVQEGLGTTK